MATKIAVQLSRRKLMQASAASLAGVKNGLAASALLATKAGAQPASQSVAGYILARLAQHRVEKLFGIPGFTCKALFEAAALPGSKVACVITASDSEAGQAADGYARVRGLGAVALTYGVGTLALAPVIAGAFAERSPVVVINGGPSDADLAAQAQDGLLYEHSSGRPQSDMTIFREITAFAGRASKAADVPRIVDAALSAALLDQRPVYVEIAHDIWTASLAAPGAPLRPVKPPAGGEDALAAQILARLAGASKPVLLLGIEIARYDLGSQIDALVRKLGIPWATTLLAKSVLDESTPGFAGVYGGSNAVPALAQLVEQADVILAIGCVFGVRFRRLVTGSRDRLVVVANDKVRTGTATGKPANLATLATALASPAWTARPEWIANANLPGLAYEQRRQSLPRRPASPAGTLSYDQVLGAVSQFLTNRHIVISDTSLSMYAAGDLKVAGAGSFVCNGVWQSIGFSLGAAIGVALGQDRRPVVICGDGGFQLNPQSLSTMVAMRVPVIVIVLDNGLYGIEQFLVGGYYGIPSASPLPWLALNRWDYEGLAKAMGFASTASAGSPAEFARALASAAAFAGPALISVRIDPHSLPAGLPAT